MTFRKRILIIIASPVVLIAGILLLYYFASTTISRQESNHGLAENLTIRIIDLNFVADRYFIYRHPGIRDNWINQHEKLQQFILTVKGENRQEEVLLKEIAATGRKIASLFRMLSEDKSTDLQLEKEREERLLEAVLLKSRMMYSDSVRLETASAFNLHEVRRIMIGWALAVAIIITATITFGAVQLTRRLIHNVNLLEEATRRIASGENDVRVEVGTKDEMGALAASFNEMSNSLKKHRLYLENSRKVLELENRMTKKAEEALRKENEVRLQAEDSLKKLNADLEGRVRERTEELQRANLLLERMKDHADREAYQARVASERHRDHLRKLQRLIKESRELFTAMTLEEVIGKITSMARDITGSRYSVIGHGFTEGKFGITAASRLEGSAPCPPTSRFSQEQGGVYKDLFERGEMIILSDRDLRSHPRWWGLPEGHVSLRGLLCVPIFGTEASVIGMLMTTDRIDGGDYTEDDAMILSQLATITSIAIRCIMKKRES